jgi:hypothetical protein
MSARNDIVSMTWLSFKGAALVDRHHDPPYRIIRQITWRTEIKACFDWLQIRNKTRLFSFFDALIKEGIRTKLFHTACKTVLDCMRGERLVEKLVGRERMKGWE